MEGSKNKYKRRSYEDVYGMYASYWSKGDFNRKIRRMHHSVDVPNGGYFKKVDGFWEWMD